MHTQEHDSRTTDELERKLATRDTAEREFPDENAEVTR
jgi:hypothetical protein